MKTEQQKRAKQLLSSIPLIYAVKLGTERADFRTIINDEVYVTVGSLYINVTGKLKRYGKKHGWTALDMFPAFVSCDDYGSYTYLVRVAVLKRGGEELKNYLFPSGPYRKSAHESFDRLLSLACSEWPSDSQGQHSKMFKTTEDHCQKYIDVWEERNKLIYTKSEDVPDIETCIRVLKAAGYKIQKPVIQYEEI